MTKKKETKNNLKLKISFKENDSDDLLKKIFINDLSIREIIGDENQDIKKTGSSLTDILLEVVKKNNGLSPEVLNNFILENYKKYTLKQIVLSSLICGQIAIENAPSISQAIFITEIAKFENIFSCIKNFYEEKLEEMKKKDTDDSEMQRNLNKENIKELLTLNYIGTILELSNTI